MSSALLLMFTFTEHKEGFSLLLCTFYGIFSIVIEFYTISYIFIQFYTFIRLVDVRRVCSLVAVPLLFFDKCVVGAPMNSNVFDFFCSSDTTRKQFKAYWLWTWRRIKGIFLCSVIILFHWKFLMCNCIIFKYLHE